MTHYDPLTDGSGGVFARPSKKILMIAIAFIMMMIFMAIGAWITYFTSLRTSQPLSIVSCSAESYVAPGTITDDGEFVWNGEQGPEQEECERPFAPRNDTWDASLPIEVAGQVCVDSDNTVSYNLEIQFISIESSARITVLDFPAAYGPGCDQPFNFDYFVPNTIFGAAEPGASLGLWKIVGVAYPARPNQYDTYQWDVTSTVEVLAPLNQE